MADKRELLLVIKGRDQGAKKVLDGVGDAADDAKDDLSNMRAGLDKLDGQIDTTTRTIANLRKEINKSGDLALIKDLEKAQRDLNRFNKQRKLLIGEDDGRDSAEEFSIGFSQRIGPLLARAPISPHLAAAAAAAAPLISSVLAGAVTLGMGAGAVGAGLKIAAQDPVVQAAAKQVGGEISLALSQSASAFVPETLKALSFLRREFSELRPLLRDIFDDAAGYVEPLTRGVAGFARELAPGIRDAVQNAGPLIDMLEVQIPRAGAVIGDVISDLSRSSEESADTIAGVLTVLEGTIFTVGKLTSLLSEYGKFIGLGPLQIFGDIMSKGDESTSGWVDSLSEWATAATTAGVAAETSAEKNQKLIDSLEGIEDAATQARRAELDFAEGLDELDAAVQKNGTTLDIGSEKGRANRRVLEDLISTSDRAGQAAEDRALAEGASAEKAAAAGARIRETWINDLVASAEKAGYSKREIEKMVAAARKADQERIRIYYDQIFRTFGKPYSDYTGIGGSSTRGYAGGGYIDMPGPKGKDNGLIAAAPGEYMLDAGDVDKLGGPRAIDAWRKSLHSAPPPSGAAPLGGGAHAGGLEVVARWGGGPTLGGLEAAFSTVFHNMLRTGQIQLGVRIGQTTHKVVVG